VSWNNFSGASLTFTGEQLAILTKAEMLAGGSVHVAMTAPDMTRYRLVPAIPLFYTAADTTAWTIYDNADPVNLVQNKPFPSIGVIKETGTPTAHNVVLTETDPAITGTTGPPPASQPGGGPVNTDDDRFTSATIFGHSILWTGGNDGCTPPGDTMTRSCLRLVGVTLGASPAVVKDFDAGIKSIDVYYPAETLDSIGHLVVGFSISSSTLNPSAAVVALGGASGGAVYGVGAAPYGGTRWGDYSQAVTDPTDPTKMWVSEENATSSGPFGLNWGTALAEVTIAP
jgi:hypothetical protein